MNGILRALPLLAAAALAGPGGGPSSAKAILSYSFLQAKNRIPVDSHATISGTSIQAFLPPGTDVTALRASFTLSPKANAAVFGRAQSAGASAVDFSRPVSYVVTAEDGSAQTWTVTVVTDIAAFDDPVRSFLATYSVPAASIAVTHGEKLVYLKAYGLQDKEAAQAATVHSLFRLASVSKPLTSIAILKLVEQGKLRFSDTVFGAGGLLGTTYGTQPYGPHVAEIKVEHLLHHTAGGWPNDSSDPMFSHPGMTAAELISWTLDHRPLAHAPGSAYAYSNFGYCVLGRVIERVTGQDYASAVKSLLLQPIGIADMAIAGNTLADRLPNEVKYYGQGGEDPYGFDIHRMDSHGGWVATAKDLANVLVHVDGFPVKPDVLSARSIAAMTAPSSANAGYACGWLVNSANNWWHIGCSGPAYQTGMGSAKRIGSGSAKRIAPGSAKRIAFCPLLTALVVGCALLECGGLMPVGNSTLVGQSRGLLPSREETPLSAWRVEMDRLVELVRLHRMRTGSREVARLLGMGPNTERAYRQALAAAGLLAGPVEELPALETLKAAVEKHAPARPAVQQASSVEAFGERIGELVAQGLGPRAVYDRLRLEEAGFRASHSAVKRYCRRLERERGVRAEDVAIPVETPAGEIAQVDFGYVGRLYDPQAGMPRKAWAFVMVLGFSRHMVVRVVFDQRVETWLHLHAEAFAELGGVVETVVPDNLKAAVVRAAFGIDGASDLNRSYREFARHYGFKVDPAPIYAPEKKGKVESGVKYVKGNFFKGRDGADVDKVRPDLARWVREIAGTREHGTTGKQPLSLFERVEKAALLPLPTVAWEPVTWRRATVHRDSHVIFDKRLYSVPWRLIGKELWLRATRSTITVHADDVRVATHDRRSPGLRSTLDEHLPDHRAELRHRSRSYWEERADLIGPETGALVREVFDSDDVLSMLRTVQAMVTHLTGFPRERAEAASRRARFYGNHKYGALKNILARALDREPLPIATAPPSSPAETPRFARTAKELIQLPLELTDEPC